MDEDELPPLDEHPDESALAAEAAWQRLQLERQQRLSAAPPQQQPQGPAGAQTYDRAAELIAAGRKGPQEVARVLRARGFDVGGYGGPVAAVEQRKPLLSAAPPDVQLPAPNVQSAAPQPAAPQAAAPQDDYKAQLAALMERLDRSRAEQEAEINAGYERSHPSDSEKWLAIAAALASPTQHGSFGEVMGNVFQSLLGYKQGVRGAENARQQQLAKLRQAYDLEGTRALARGLKPPTKPTRRISADSFGKRFDTSTGFDVPNAAQVAALVAHPEQKPDFVRRFGEDLADEILARNGVQAGGY